VTPVVTRTRVVILQHPRERDVAIGTARMASLCLPNSELHVGVRWRDSLAFARAVSDPAQPAALLYPGEGAIDVMTDPPAGQVTLVVVDGTWSQAKKVVRENPELAALPRYAFRPPSPSEYRIRKEPRAEYVSTIEALYHVLGALEGDPERFRALLAPFRAMVDAQLECEGRYRNTRVRRARVRKVAAARPPSPLGGGEKNVVCVYGEANAWPYSAGERTRGLRDELVHWVAQRLDTGETFDAVIAPRNALSPATPLHIGLSADVLAEGGTVGDLRERWHAFIRDSDVVCSWGRYATSLFVDTGAELPVERVDLREAARVFARGKVGTLEDFVARIGAAPAPISAPGRAHSRLAQIAAIARAAAAGWNQPSPAHP
jgi:DTW domain-containing protein YfiP